MQHSQNSATDANTWPAMAWSPAAWFPGFGGQANLPAQGMETMRQSFDPWLRAMSQTNIEFLRLLTRRSQAAVEMATKAAQCREPQDLMGLQTHFWQTAVQQHTDAARQIVSSWGSVMPLAGALANSIAQPAASVKATAETARDFLATTAEAEAKDNNAAPASLTASRTPGGDRDRRSAA